MIGELSRISQHPVSRETVDRLREFEALVADASARQNLVSRATLETFWERHVLDSAQLIRFSANPSGNWCDIGSGAGLPGVVIACVVEGPVTLIEPRRLRATFLEDVVERLGLNAKVVQSKAESVSATFDTITARAVAPLSRLLEISDHLSTRNSVMVFPKGKRAESELAEARRSWQASFHVEPSLIDADSKIILARDVRFLKQ